MGRAAENYWPFGASRGCAPGASQRGSDRSRVCAAAHWGVAGERAGMTLRGSGRQPLPAKLSRADAGHLPECAREVRWIRVADLAGRIDHGVAGVGQQIGGNLESQVFDQVRVAEIGLIQPALQRADAYAGELGS